MQSEIDTNNRTKTYSYYPDGLLNSTSNDLNETLTLRYDSRGNVFGITQPKGEEVITQRDLAGNVLQKVDSKGVTTKYTYDQFNRLMSVETGVTANRPTGDLTSYQYSATGQLVQITNPDNDVTTFEYDILDRLIKKTSPLGQITELAYDGNGNVIWEKDPNGNEKTFTYNSQDRLLSKVLPDNIYSIAYDPEGNVSSISDSDSLVSYTYEKVNGESMVKTTSTSGVELPSITLTNSYNSFGNRTELSGPYGTFNYSFDNGGRLTSVINPFSEVFGLTYDSSNRLRVISRPGSTTNLDFDQNSFLTSLVHKQGSATVAQALYQSDAVGNRISMTTTSGVHSYSYDENYQLKTASNPEGGGSFSSETFAYDSLGNRLNDQLGSYVYDNKKQRLLEDYQFLYSYDTNGNLTSKTKKGMVGTITNYVYSSENQLIEVQIHEASIHTKSVYYRYDALGRRSQRTVILPSFPNDAKSRVWVYDGNEMLAEHNEDLDLLAVYTQSGLRTDDTLSVRVTSDGASEGIASQSGSYFYLKDGLGSITDVTGSSGDVVQRYVYSSFGKILAIKDGLGNDISSSPQVNTSFTYTNREWDGEVGLYYYRARYYDAQIGRFMQEDPHPGKMGSPVTIHNRYAYAKGNPIRYVDPNGEFIFSALLLASIIGTSSFATGAIATAALIGFTGTLAAYEAKNNFDTKQMLQRDGAEAFGVAALVATAAAGGAWIGLKAGQGVASFLKLSGWKAAAFEGAAITAFSSAAASGTTTLLTGSSESAGEDALVGFGIGFITGGLLGGAGFYFRQPVTVPLAIVSEGQYFIQFSSSEAQEVP